MQPRFPTPSRQTLSNRSKSFRYNLDATCSTYPFVHCPTPYSLTKCSLFREKRGKKKKNIISNYGSKRNRNRLSRISSSRFLSLNPKINPITSSTVSPVNICTLCETLSSFLPSVKRKPVLPSILNYRRPKLVLGHRIICSLNTLSS